MKRTILSASIFAGMLVAAPLLVGAAWTAAPASPPSNNVEAPINVSGNAQTKTGNLTVSGLAADSLLVQSGGSALITGNLGVGVSPAYKVDVNGTVNASRYCISGASCITAWPTGGPGGSITINTSGGLTGGGTGSTFNLGIDTNTIQARVTGSCSGQVMVGINSDGSVSCETDDTGGGGPGPTPGFDAVLAAGNSTGRGFTAGGSTFTGDLHANDIYGNSFIYSSDERLKTDIKVLPDALTKVMALNGVSFNWKNSGKPAIGVIAQNIEQVYPELVTTNPSTGYKAVEEGNLVGPLIEAIKAQQKEIQALQVEVAALKNK